MSTTPPYVVFVTVTGTYSNGVTLDLAAVDSANANALSDLGLPTSYPNPVSVYYNDAIGDTTKKFRNRAEAAVVATMISHNGAFDPSTVTFVWL